MIYKVHKCGSYNIHTLKTDRFKNIRLEIIFRNNIDKKNVGARTLLFDLLLECNKEYDTRRKLSLKLEDLYNANLYAYTSKVGASVNTSVIVDFLNPKYTSEDYLEEAISLPFNMIFKPNITNDEFCGEDLAIVKNRMINNIESMKENPRNFAIKNAIKEMNPDSFTAIDVKGTVSEVNSINSEKLLNVYNDIIEHDYIDIYVIGDIDEDKVIDAINKYALFNTIKNHKVEIFTNNKPRKKIHEVVKPSDNTQSQIIYLLSVKDLTEEDRKYNMQIFDMILGGGSLETKLYRNLRDKNSLCYNVFSSYFKYDNLILISTAVDKKNIKKAKSIIADTIKEMANNVTQEEVDKAINSIITSLKLSSDSPSRIIDEHFFVDNYELDPMDTRIEKYKKVSLQDVEKLAKKVSINTIYIEEGK